MMQAFAPFVSGKKAGHQQHTSPRITSAAFESANFMVKCDPRGPDNRYMSVCLLHRGDVVVKDMNASVATIKTKASVQFVSWNPTGFKQRINWQKPVLQDGADVAPFQRSVLNICNNTAISAVFQTINCKFDLMFTKCGFVHWYVGEGMEEGEFSGHVKMLLLLRRITKRLLLTTNHKENLVSSERPSCS